MEKSGMNMGSAPPPPYYEGGPHMHTNVPPVYVYNPPPNTAPAPVGFVSSGGGDGYPPHQPVSHQVVQLANLRQRSTRLVCPHCRADVTTRVTYTTGRFTHIAALLLCLIGCWPCACIPYCSDACMDAEHECPSCKNFIGTYRR